MKLGINSSTGGLTTSTWATIITLSNFVSFDVIPISSMEYIYEITAGEKIYYQKGFISNITDFTYFKLTITGTNLSKVSFGQFSLYNIGFLVHDEGKSNYLYLIEYDSCSNQVIQMPSGSSYGIRSAYYYSPSTKGYFIKFSKPDSNLHEYDGDFPQIDDYVLYFLSSKAGIYYSEVIIKRVT